MSRFPIIFLAFLTEFLWDFFLAYFLLELRKTDTGKKLFKKMLPKKYPFIFLSREKATFATPINPSEKLNDLYKRMSSVDFLLGAVSGRQFWI